MLEVFMYNAGKGDCVRVHFGKGRNIFVDSGVTKFSSNFQEICEKILQSGETLDVLILTHVDVDHIGGILGNLRHSWYQCPFQEVWMNHSGCASLNERTLSIQQNDEVYARLVKQGIPVKSMGMGNLFEIEGAEFEVFWPDINILKVQHRQYKEVQLARHSDYHQPLKVLAEKELPAHDTSQSNKHSVVFSFAFDNHRLLFTGDAWAEDVIRAKGAYDLVKLPHHGSARNISDTYQDTIRATNFLICTDGIKHPDKQTIAKLEKWYGAINIYSTSEWWGCGYFTGDDRQHQIHYHLKEGLVISW